MRLYTISKSIVIVILVSTIGICQSVRESFEYTSGTVLDTLVGESGNGWEGGWDLFEGTPSTIEVTAKDLIWDFVDFDIPHTGLHVIGVNSGGAWQWQRTGRYLSETWHDEAGKIYWLSFTMEMQNFADQSWAGVGLYDSLAEGPLFGKGWGNLVYSIGSDTLSETNTEYNNDVGPLWLVVKMIMTGDTLDERIFMWVNPDPADPEPDTTAADAKAFREMNDGFNRVVVHFGGQFAEQQLTIDEIRLGNSWADVSSQVVSVEKGKDFGPAKYSLFQNYPNPFNPSTTISFTLAQQSSVTLKVFDVLGNEIATLIENEIKESGSNDISFDASNLPSGIYVYRLLTENFSDTKKMLLLK